MLTKIRDLIVAVDPSFGQWALEMAAASLLLRLVPYDAEGQGIRRAIERLNGPIPECSYRARVVVSYGVSALRAYADGHDFDARATIDYARAFCPVAA